MQTSLLKFFTKSNKASCGTPPTDSKKFELHDVIIIKDKNWPALVTKSSDGIFFNGNEYYVQFLIKNECKWVLQSHIVKFAVNCFPTILTVDSKLAFDLAERLAKTPNNNRLNLLSNSDKENKTATPKSKKPVIYSSDEDESFNIKKRKKALSPSENRLNNFKFEKEVVTSPLQSSQLLNKNDEKLDLYRTMFATPKNKKIETMKSTPSLTPTRTKQDCKFVHQTLDWLKPDKRRDAQGRLMSHPDHDTRTLLVPTDYLRKVTPALKQWWTIKSQRFDCVLFFKIGKFYELYHMDALLGIKELGLSLMGSKDVDDNGLNNSISSNLDDSIVGLEKVNNTPGSNTGPVNAHSGFPEIVCEKYMEMLVEKGYKVCRVEQTETVHAMGQRTSKGSQKSCDISSANNSFSKRISFSDENNPVNNSKAKLVTREVCRVMSRGTRTLGQCPEGMSFESLNRSDTHYLMAVYERSSNVSTLTTNTKKGLSYGVCCIDITIGTFNIAQICGSIDTVRADLKNLLTQFPPTEILYERGNLSKSSLQLIETLCPGVIKQTLTPQKEFWSAADTLMYIKDMKTDNHKTILMQSTDIEYTRITENSNTLQLGSIATNSQIIDEDDLLCLTAKPEWVLAIRCLGACIWYLTDSLIESEIVMPESLVNICLPVSTHNNEIYTDPCVRPKCMIIDDITIANLEVFPPFSAKTYHSTVLAKGHSLYEKLSHHTTTNMGKRLLKSWLTCPTLQIGVINARLDVVEYFGQIGVIQFNDIDATLKLIPTDLERMVQKIVGLSREKSSDHPDTRAVLFEEIQYSRKKITDFVSVLSGITYVSEIMLSLKKMLESSNENCPAILSSMCNPQLKDSNNNQNVNVWIYAKQFVQTFQNDYDFEQAKKDGLISPQPGLIPDYDSAQTVCHTLEAWFDDYMKNVAKDFDIPIKALTYWGTGKNRYQIQIADEYTHLVPDHFELRSQKKGARRYKTKEMDEMLLQLQDAEYQRDQGLAQSVRHIFANFVKHKDIWNFATQCIAKLDVLMGFAKYAFYSGNSLYKCRPIIYAFNNENPFLKFMNCTHPCMDKNTYADGDFIPNDIVMNKMPNSDSNTDGDTTNDTFEKIIILTGPNMGGKSTLLRQVGLITIMAHIGCYVPAQHCELSLVDRIFTRLGAKDNIMGGESTFYIELKETSNILHYATSNSLVLIDELGRGTATFDGVAIADAVIKYIQNEIKCRTIFSTHYHMLVKDIQDLPSISLAHMACYVDTQEDTLEENDNNINNNQNDHKTVDDNKAITFLYKLKPNACPNSYGFHAALLAGMPKTIVQKAFKRAKEFELQFQSMAIQ